MKVYTKTGDGGMTSLVGGTRVSKSDARLEAYGTVDELNSNLGLLVTKLHDEKAKTCIVGAQNMLFGVGAVLADGRTGGVDTSDIEKYDGEGAVSEMEHSIDALSEGLPKWRGFTLPGGCEAAALAHVCRTVCRRAERRIVSLSQVADVPSWLMKYMNRLSDLLYVLALRENFLAGKEEILWQKRL